MFGLLRYSSKAEHRFCQGNLSAYADGELSAREQERVRSHLAECEACRGDLEGLQWAVALLRQLPRVNAPHSFGIPPTAPAPSLPLWLRPWAFGALRAATGVAAILLVVALAGNALARPTEAPLRAVSLDLSARELAQSAPAGEAPEALALPMQQDGVPPPEATSQFPMAAAAAPADAGSQPTLTPEEAERAMAAPRGMGEQLEESPTAKGGGADAEEVGEAMAATAAPAGTSSPPVAPTVGAEAQPEGAPAAEMELYALAPPAHSQGVAGDQAPYGAREEAAVPHLRPAPPQRYWGGGPWLWCAVGSGILLVVLLTATLWVRDRRSRWL